MDTCVRADVVQIAEGARIDPAARLRAHEVRIEEGVTVGPGVDIRAGRIDLGQGTRLSGDLSVLFVEDFEIGPLGTIERGCIFRGRSMKAGRHLYIGDRTIIGGGGAMTPGAHLVIGDGASIFSESYVNLAEKVSIGSRTALSSRVTILTHGCWQPVLDGYPSLFAPVRIGDNVVVYFGSTVLPGCDIGEGTLVGAASLVNRSLPSRCFAAGNPVRILRQPYPPDLTEEQRLELVVGILHLYANTLAYKGFTDVQNDVMTSRELRCRFENESYHIRIGEPSPGTGGVEICLSLDPWNAGSPGRIAVFDLTVPALQGHRDRVVEDLRDHLRRTGIRILDDQPFQNIPPAALNLIPRD